MAPRAPRVLLVLRVRLDLLVPRAPRVQQGILALLAHRGQRELLARPDRRVTQVSKDLQALLGIMVQLEARALKGQLAKRDRQALRGMWAPLEKQGRLDPRARKVLRAILDKQGLRVPKALQE